MTDRETGRHATTIAAIQQALTALLDDFSYLPPGALIAELATAAIDCGQNPTAETFGEDAHDDPRASSYRSPDREMTANSPRRARPRSEFKL